MNPVLRLVSGDVSSDADGSNPELVPGGAPRHVPLHPQPSELIEPGHLTRCPQCGEMNGRSADTCWNCEIDLQTTWLRDVARSPASAAASIRESPAVAESDHEAWHDLGLDAHAPQAVAAGSDADSATMPGYWSLPVLTASVELGDAMSAYPEHMLPMPAARAPRWPLGMTAVIAGVLVLFGAGAYLYIDIPADEQRDSLPAAARDRGFGRATEPGMSTITAPAGTSGGDLAHVDAALRAAERLAAQPLPDAGDADIVPADRGPEATPTRRGKTRGLSRQPIAPPTALAPAPANPRPVPQTTAPIGPCTQTVAALGLCGAPSQPKE